jgi:hypothetical protein
LDFGAQSSQVIEAKNLKDYVTRPLLPSILFQFLTDATCSLEIFFEEENLLAGM